MCWGPYFSQKFLESENGSTLLLCNRISKKSYIGQDAHGVRLADSRSELGVEFGLWSSERPPKSALFHGIFWNCVIQKNGFIPKEILELCGNANGPWAVAGPGHDIRTYNHLLPSPYVRRDAIQPQRTTMYRRAPLAGVSCCSRASTTRRSHGYTVHGLVFSPACGYGTKGCKGTFKVTWREERANDGARLSRRAAAPT